MVLGCLYCLGLASRPKRSMRLESTLLLVTSFTFLAVLTKLKCLKSFLERFEDGEIFSSSDYSTLTSLMIYFKHVILK